MCQYVPLWNLCGRVFSHQVSYFPRWVPTQQTREVVSMSRLGWASDVDGEPT